LLVNIILINKYIDIYIKEVIYIKGYIWLESYRWFSTFR